MDLWLHGWRLDYICLNGLREGSMRYMQREATGAQSLHLVFPHSQPIPSAAHGALEFL
jgi:hypothetical protein